VDLAPRRLVRRQVQSNALYRRTIAWLFLGMFTILFLLGFSYIYVKAGVSRLNYTMNTLQSENEQLTLENAKIRGQIAELRSLDRIEEIAFRELGMIKNETVEYMVLSSTIVADGKIRPEENETAETQRSMKPLDAVIRFLLAGIFR